MSQSSSSSSSSYTAASSPSHSSSSHYPSNSKSPSLTSQSIELLAKDAVKRYVKDNQVIGLGSGSTIAFLVKEMARLENKNTVKFIVTSLQIKIKVPLFS